MAQIEEASPICRGKNLSWETILLFYNNMPRESMPKNLFNSYTEARINGWTQTHSQIARQLAFYYEENGICYPRFTKEMNYADIFKYMQNWAAKYFIPNPYAPSLKEQTPTCIYEFIIYAIKSGQTNFDEILDSIFGIALSSHDKVRVYLNNFTDLIIDGNSVSLNTRTSGMESSLHPNAIYAIDPQKYFEYFNISVETISNKQRVIDNNVSLQQIYYGAPGTGKSHEVKKMTNKENSIRTTFHPDSDYSTFVGAYKPIVDERPRYGLNQKETVRLMDEDKHPLNEKTITYTFVPQAFIKAYAEAWSRYAKWQQGNGDGQAQPYYLVIEEINRGNCAQIFGDLFQLLDRCSNGLSGYAISPDNDIQRYLSETEFDPSKAQWGLHNLELTGMFMDDEGEVLSTADEIKSGRLMLLPPNLHIWATMNTSDQSLFPIDSAFKRRWDWQYMPISYKNEGWTIEIGDKTYKWVDFQHKINEGIYDIDNSEDKQLGDYFVNADRTGNVIKVDTLLNKILFYIWNDVCKDEPEQIFSCEDVHGNKKAVKFSDFFCEKAEQDQKLQDFMRYNKVRAIGEEAAEAKESGNKTDNEVNA